jgi:UDP-3-O-acyl-N-acetylglucosamine deacetylase
LLGAPLRAHVIAFKAGHRLHATLVRRILASRAAWTTRNSDERLPAAEVAAFGHLKERILPQPVRAAV